MMKINLKSNHLLKKATIVFIGFPILLNKQTINIKSLPPFLIILVLIINNGCAKIPYNDDPIIGIWSKNESYILNGNTQQGLKKEWIFNDAYLGRFHLYQDNTLTFLTDFRWELQDSIYFIRYPGTDLVEVQAKLKKNNPEEPLTLESKNGTIIAIKE